MESSFGIHVCVYMYVSVWKYISKGTHLFQYLSTIIIPTHYISIFWSIGSLCTFKNNIDRIGMMIDVSIYHTCTKSQTAQQPDEQKMYIEQGVPFWWFDLFRAPYIPPCLKHQGRAMFDIS